MSGGAELRASVPGLPFSSLSPSEATLVPTSGSGREHCEADTQRETEGSGDRDQEGWGHLQTCPYAREASNLQVDGRGSNPGPFTRRGLRSNRPASWVWLQAGWLLASTWTLRTPGPGRHQGSRVASDACEASGDREVSTGEAFLRKKILAPLRSGQGSSLPAPSHGPTTLCPPR